MFLSKLFGTKSDREMKKLAPTIKKINQLGSDRIVNAIGGKKYKNCIFTL